MQASISTFPLQDKNWILRHHNNLWSLSSFASLLPAFLQECATNLYHEDHRPGQDFSYLTQAVNRQY